MKRFLILVAALLSINSAVKASGCWGYDDYDSYTSYIFAPEDFQAESGLPQYLEYWRSYAGGDIEPYHISNLSYVDDFANSNNPIIEYARNKKDMEMQAYLRDLCKYIQLNDKKYDRWNYPDEDEMLNLNKSYKAILQRAKAYTGSRLKDRYALLAMRCMFQLEQYTEVLSYWGSTGTKVQDPDCKKTMKGLYAGALYRTDKVNNAMVIYAEINDVQSLFCCLDGKRNFDGIKQIYDSDNNSPVLQYLVQDFVESCQDNCVIGEGAADSWINQEARKFVPFANEVVAKKKTNNPIFWKEAAAAVSAFLGDYANAEKYIAECDKMSGTQREKDNARIIRDYVYLKAHGYKQKQDFIVAEMKWLEENSSNSRIYSDGHSMFLLELGRQTDNDLNTSYLLGNKYIRSLSESQLEQIRAFVKNQKKMDVLQKYLFDRLYSKPTDADFDEVLGTRALAAMDFDKAEKYLQNVPADFYKDMALGSYMNERNYKTPSWTRMPSEVGYGEGLSYVKSNLKYEFCKDIKALTAKYNAAKGDQKCDLAYELAVMYHSLTHWGHCWFLTHYYWSVYDDDDESYQAYTKKALEYLGEAAKSNTKTTKQNALYGAVWVSWHDYEYFVSWEPGYTEEVTPQMSKVMDDLCDYWDGVFGKSKWTMECDYVMNWAAKR